LRSKKPSVSTRMEEPKLSRSARYYRLHRDEQLAKKKAEYAAKKAEKEPETAEQIAEREQKRAEAAQQRAEQRAQRLAEKKEREAAERRAAKEEKIRKSVELAIATSRRKVSEPPAS